MNFRLNKSQKLFAYEKARKAWVKGQGKRVEASRLFELDEDIAKLDPALIKLLILIALLLFEYWINSEVDEPSTQPTGHEPINWEDENAAD